MTYHLNSRETWHGAMRRLSEEFARWGVSQWRTDPPRVQSRDSERYEAREQARVLVAWTMPDGRSAQMAVDTFHTLRENLIVAVLNLGDMRMIEKRGGAASMAQAYLQLEGTVAPEADPYTVLGVRPDAPPEVIEASYRALARTAHPDRGGSEEAMQRLNRARERVLDGGRT